MKLAVAFLSLSASGAMAQDAGFVGQWIERCTDQAAILFAQVPKGDSRTSPVREAIKAQQGQQSLCSIAPMGICMHAAEQATCLNGAIAAFDSQSARLVATFPDQIEGKPIEKQLFAEAMARGVTDPVPGSLYERCQEGELAGRFSAMLTPRECDLRRATFGYFYLLGLKQRYAID